MDDSQLPLATSQRPLRAPRRSYALLNDYGLEDETDRLLSRLSLDNIKPLDNDDLGKLFLLFLILLANYILDNDLEFAPTVPDNDALEQTTQLLDLPFSTTDSQATDPLAKS